MAMTKDLLQAVLESSGVHSDISMADLNANQRTVFGFLEAIDFGCFEMGCISLGETKLEEVKDYILDHYEAPIPLPSALGLLTGNFNFLQGEV